MTSEKSLDVIVMPIERQKGFNMMNNDNTRHVAHTEAIRPHALYTIRVLEKYIKRVYYMTGERISLLYVYVSLLWLAFHSSERRLFYIL